MQPLAERLRPKCLEDYVGQEHLVGEGAVLRRMVDGGKLSSFILWGPPGVGKTTLARIVANKLEVPFYTLSAISAGVKEVRDVITRAKEARMFGNRSAVLFIDEIHRFSKSQQDSLLGAVEDGTVTLIGATTENPSFQVISPLLSRCQVFTLKPLTVENMRQLIDRAVEVIGKEREIEIKEDGALLRHGGGDGRRLLNLLELVVNGVPGEEKIVVDNALVSARVAENPLAYDRDGEMHYDIASAFIKSIRGSDVRASVYWLARMIEGGEDPRFIARRLVISASEDIGLANPNALLLATACMEAVEKIGMPEGRIPLAECTIYLAQSKKDNSAYKYIDEMLEAVRQTGDLPVPLHLRNAPTELMRGMGYGKEYKYPHDYPGHWVEQEYLPEEMKEK